MGWPKLIFKVNNNTVYSDWPTSTRGVLC